MQRSLEPDAQLPSITLKTVGLHPLIYSKRILKKVGSAVSAGWADQWREARAEVSQSEAGASRKCVPRADPRKEITTFTKEPGVC